ncbi:MAG: hypothetical protein OEZ02_05830 [Anaerolineae bacterium]|nr:hypothetical protein [Anaerolineae bacterium]
MSELAQKFKLDTLIHTELSVQRPVPPRRASSLAQSPRPAGNQPNSPRLLLARIIERTKRI